ncbi:MAG: LysM peptidoglycan-binding domain-containing protein [Bacteroidales bacterium]|nr:LysM peptidoglycan-binding domain-containing protein [Bacteroidales bacterium]
MNMKVYAILAATLLIGTAASTDCNAQFFNFRNSDNGKSKKQLLRENELLQQRIRDLEEEILWLKNDAAKDTLDSEAMAAYESSEGDDILAGDIAPEDYTQEITDSLLSVWYLLRQNQRLHEGDNFNMDSVRYTTNLPDTVLIGRLQRMNSFITLPYNETVKNCMILYSERMPKKMCNMLGLSKYYMPIFEETFRKYDLPLELKYLSIIESALNPNAVSRVGATGMWQFMYATAKGYGLEIDSFVDERRDPFKSVDAAARYLRDAYHIFGDWSLAISSYNCGSGNVNKAIKRAGGRRDFWDIYPYLPKETRGYVPLMVGAMYAINYAKEYGLEATPIQLPERVDTFKIRKNLHFRQISEVIGIPLSDLRDMNPQYYKDIIPGNQGEYILRLPFYYSSDFLEMQDSIYKYKTNEIFASSVDVNRPSRSSSYGSTSSSTTTQWKYYKVRRGDSLGKIASRNHVSINQLKSWNGLRGNTIREGQRLKVGRTTVSSGSSVRSSGGSSSGTSSSNTSSTVYTVKRGDTLTKIAARYPGVTANDIMKYNNCSENIRPGMKLKIPKK